MYKSTLHLIIRQPTKVNKDAKISDFARSKYGKKYSSKWRIKSELYIVEFV